jgi:NADPH-dependent 7-cyano-7-deazaguanine reductase QueF
MEKKKEPTVQITYRAPVSVVEKLDELCRVFGFKHRSEFLNGVVVTEYDKLKGNPEFSAVMEQFNELVKRLDGLKGNV